MLVVKSYILQKALSSVIAPHGITDLIHARQHNLTSELLQINGVSLVYSHVFHFADQNVLSTLFLLLSIVHFRHDMPNIFGIPRFILSSFLLSLFSMYPISFFPYMVILHVPNHYRMNWWYIKKKKSTNIPFLIFITALFSYAGDIVLNNYLTSYVVDMAKGFVVAHIIYNELHVFHKPLYSIEDKE